MSFADPARIWLARPLIVVLTGASGSGKTAVAQHLRGLRPALPVFGFDDIGIPDAGTMLREHGSEMAWQRDAIGRWMARLRKGTHPVAVLEGQMMLPFLAAAAAESGARSFVPLLLDCDDPIRFARLVTRGTPQLVGRGVTARAQMFRQQAQETGVPVLDTGHMPLSEVVRTVLAHCDRNPRSVLHRKAFHSRHRAVFARLF